MIEQRTEMLRDVKVREQSLLRNVYLWMTLALAVTAMVAYGVASNPGLMRVFYGNPMVMLLLVVAEFAIVFFLSARLQTMTKGAAIGSFLAYSVLNGVIFSTIFYVYDLGAVFKAFSVAAVMFLGMSMYATTTKRDLHSWGYYLMVSLWGLVIATLMNMFFRSSGMDYIISILGVVIFMGLTAWDTQKVVQVNNQYAWDMDEDTFSKLGVVFALSLYLDFLNIFLYLLRFFSNGDRRN
jgi:FtsH-binding integral membrane protein